jgi:hypothetical protein
MQQTVPVCRQLDAVSQPSRQIVHEMIRRARVTAADKPARHKFRVRVKRNPSPDAANARLSPHSFRHVFVFRVTERPYFVTLDALAIQVAKNLVLIRGASRAKLHQKFLNRRAMDSRHADSGAERTALNQTGNHADLFFFAQFIHVHNLYCFA